jgi:uncharacterized protein (DUF924 family)
MSRDNVIERVLTFWFGSPDSEEFGRPRKAWFEKNAAFDAEIAEKFGDDHHRAARGELDHLAESAEGCVALMILLDQFPRNMFRGSPHAFATDSKALTMARLAIERGFDSQVLPIYRKFLYLPFEHSENRADQEYCVALFQTGGDAEDVKWAMQHRDIIARFGRFPHRNAVLGRESTPEELAFLQEPGSSF